MGVRRRVVLAALSMTLALAMLAGCGDEDARSTTPEATSEGEPVAKQWSTEPEMRLEQGVDYGAIIHTNKGDIIVDLFESEAPKTVNNFVFLANEGYYNGVPFHRVIVDFMVQTGDPTGTGAGGPGYRFADEKVTRDYVRGTLAMANAGPNTNGSQFFIVHKDYRLPKNYTIFGVVTDGFDVLDEIAGSPVRMNAGGERSVPTVELTITGVDVTTGQ